MAAALMMGAAVYAQNITTSPVSDRYQLEALGASSNMRYVTGMNVARYGAFIWDTENNEVGEIIGDFANCDFRGVTNDGTAFGTISNEDMVTTYSASFDMTGKSKTIESQMSTIYGVTPDGSIAVGCMLDEIMWWPTACIWKDGVRTELPVPSKAECGIDHDGANAQFISADGKVIVGYLQDWVSARPAIVWRQQADGTYAADVISKDIWESAYGQGKKYLRFEPLGLSENGKWLCLSAQKEAGGSMPTPEFMVRMNLETGEIIESETPDFDFFEPTVTNIYPTSIANDGTCIGSTKDEMGNQSGVIWKAGDKAPKLLAEVYPTVSQFEEYDYFQHHPITISADGKKIVGFGCPITVYEDGTDYDFETYLLDTEGTDGIATLKTMKPSASSRSYTINGQQVLNKKQPGLYIENGKKILVK